MKRKIYNEMLQWKQNSQGKSALMIDGARRIGKRFLSLSSRIGTKSIVNYKLLFPGGPSRTTWRWL
ncbi:hypothetical protein [Segatella copri]|uniref:Ribosomal protein S14 n=1 Tax=Segatella copri TaxID=165179 RepID=A0AAW5I430_9BACT|nr:hypothetical protein [Segatella copri]MCF0067562.1 hypothetical protein [Segatella copri]MCP9458815.1 hypothetical protein [Segatella copri]MCP9501755.1 hypothetical protein [Segatella copri]MCP9504546.1 hypothetical protein [Segatella copri]MCP9507666.1 hypothetical protein [Segatella copri]